MENDSKIPGWVATLQYMKPTIKATFLHFGPTLLDYYINPLLLEYVIKNSLYIEIKKITYINSCNLNNSMR